jgi:hypothetical protein
LEWLKKNLGFAHALEYAQFPEETLSHGQKLLASLDRNALSHVYGGAPLVLSPHSVWMKAQSDGTAIEAGSSNFGFAMHASLAGQPLCVQTAGIFVVGATAAPTVGAIYYIGTTYGAINPYSDLVSTNKITILGIGYTSSSIDMSVKRYTGIAVP